MTIFKQIPAEDRVSTRTLLHEAIPITGTIVSGTYGTFPDEGNIKNFAHGMFQSVYDYPYLSSSANHIFDLTFGISSQSSLSASVQASKKQNIYNQMAQVLVGFDKDGEIQRFDEDGNLTGGTKIDDAVFINFSRLLVKDEIKKGSFQLELGLSSSYDVADIMDQRAVIKDANGATSYRVNSPAGEYGILYISNSAGANGPLDGITGSTQQKCGLIFYQAGVAVLTSSVFMGSSEGGFLSASCNYFDASTTFTGSLEDEQITGSADAFRRRVYNIQFNNTIELNSTVYFCRVKHNEFNYSSNPTYLTGSQIRVKEQATDIPISYITSIGLYSSDNQLLAVGKFSEPIRNDNNIELTFRARLDY